MKYLDGYKFRAFVGVFFKFVEAVLELILPLLMVLLIDRGIVNQDFAYIRNIVILMGALSLLGYLSSVTCQYNAAYVSQGVGGKLRDALMKKITKFSQAEFDRFGASTLVNRMIIDINQVQLMIAMIIRLAVRTPILMIGSIFAMTRINYDLAMTLLKFFPMFVIVVIGFMYLSLNKFKSVQNSLDRFMDKVREVLSGMRIVRSFNRVQDERDNLVIENYHLSENLKGLGFVNTLSGPTTTLLMNLVMAYLIYLGAFKVESGIMTQGQMVAIINYCTQLVLALVVFMNLVMIFSRGISSVYRLKDVFEVEPSIKNKENPVKDLEGPLRIQFENVSFSYPDERRLVLKDINLEVNQGEMVGLVGLTGSGKSTLLKLLMRYYDVNEGVIWINDHNIKDINLQVLRDRIGFATQNSEFLSGSLSENVAMGKEVDVKDALVKAQGKEILEKEWIEASGRNLSGGQRQRINIARALAKKPSLLILDDSLSALDYMTDRNLRESLAKHFPDMASLVVTQRTTSLKEADRIYVLEEGRISGVGTHDSLLNSNSLYKEIHEVGVKV